MSFANEVRSELAHIIPEKTCCQISELAAWLALRGDMVEKDNGRWALQVEADNAGAARKVYRLLKDCCELKPTVVVKERKRFRQTRFYIVETVLNEREINYLQNLGLLNTSEDIKREVDWMLVGKNCCKRAYLRGVFMCKGFINRPEGNYHLEIVLNDTRMAQDIKKMLARLDVEARIGERKNNLIVYIKDSEEIGDFLRVVEASNSLLNFENVRIIKSMRNQVNRQVNCETANLGKTIDASVRQVELIEGLIAKQGMAQIPPQLKELAMLRIDHPHSTLKELGLMMNPPLTKSGVAYRMRKLEEFAEETLYGAE